QQFSFDAAQAGTGAAGGLGGGAMAFLGAQLRSGIELFLEWSDLDKLVPKVDGIITGEGKMDEQTMQGKVISGVLKLAQRHQVPCFAICGASTIEAAQLPQLQAIYSVMNISNSLEEAMQNGATKVSQLAEQLVQEQWS
ncbi:MAG: glycerate kinase, partial [Bacteroidota bacterium]